jgi:urease accessory protein UreH
MGERFAFSEYRSRTLVSVDGKPVFLDASRLVPDEAARQNVRINAGENAGLFYCPHPVIPFAKNRFHSKVEIALKPSSRLFFSDILTCGRHGMGERFAFSRYIGRTLVSVDGKPAFLDAVRLVPHEAALDGMGFFEGYACQGLLYLYGYASVPLPERANLEMALTRAREGYSIRILSDDVAGVYQFAKELYTQS